MSRENTILFCVSFFFFFTKKINIIRCVKNDLDIKTLKASLSVLKLIPGTYFNQTGNPLYEQQIIVNNKWLKIFSKSITAGVV